MKYYELFVLFNGLLYVMLIAAQKRVGWLFGILSCSAQVYVSFHANYYLDSGLNIFYVFMGIWGFIKWNEPQVFFYTSRLTKHDWWIYLATGSIISFIVGWGFKCLGNASPYMDGFTTVFSIIATFLAIRKVIDNWIIWIVIDAILAYMFFIKDLNINASLYLVYCALAIWGWMKWKKQ